MDLGTKPDHAVVDGWIEKRSSMDCAPEGGGGWAVRRWIAHLAAVQGEARPGLGKNAYLNQKIAEKVEVTWQLSISL
jgi:hypothetical protein